MTGTPTEAWTQPGVVIAGLGVAAGVVVWLWRYATAFFDLFGHANRIKKLEDECAERERTLQATRGALGDLGLELRRLHTEHVDSDAEAFKVVNNEIRLVRENMARREDVAKLEDNLTEILMDGFKKAGRGP